MNETDKKPLHEIVLDILYVKNIDKPLWITVEEVFWTITDSSVSERQVREVLDWLVYHKKARKQSGKYQIDKHEFVERANAPKASPPKNRAKQEEKPIRETSIHIKPRENPTIKTPEKKMYFFRAIALMCLLSFCVLIAMLGYRIYNTPFVFPEKPSLQEMDSCKVPKFHVGAGGIKNDSILNQRFKNIANSFNLQKTFNEELIRQQDSLQKQLINIDNYCQRLEKTLLEKHQKDKEHFILAAAAFLFLLLGIFFFKKK